METDAAAASAHGGVARSSRGDRSARPGMLHAARDAVRPLLRHVAAARVTHRRGLVQRSVARVARCRSPATPALSCAAAALSCAAANCELSHQASTCIARSTCAPGVGCSPPAPPGTNGAGKHMRCVAASKCMRSLPESVRSCECLSLVIPLPRLAWPTMDHAIAGRCVRLAGAAERRVSLRQSEGSGAERQCVLTAQARSSGGVDATARQHRAWAEDACARRARS